MESEQPPYECPHLLHENKRRSHVPLKSHLTLDSAVRGFLPTAQQELPGDEGNKRIQSLAGNDWQFCLYPSPDWVPEGWETNPKYDHYDAEEGWGAISVPGNWELQGHGVPIYANFTYPIPLDPPRVPANANPTGCYVKHFNYTAPPVPGKMGKRVFLQFEGVDSFFQCWLNGSYVGMSKDSRLTAEFDVSHLIKGGKNFLAVQVLRWSDATYLEDQDMWRTSGIHRDVLICTKPALHVSDIAVTTPLSFGSVDDAAEGGPPLTMARLESLIYLEGPSDEALSQATVTAHLVRQADGQAVMDPIKLPVTAGKWYARDMADMAAAEASHGKKFPGGHGGVAKLSVDALAAVHGGPQLWSAEAPNLYVLVLEVVDDGGEVVERESCQVGFRHTAVKDGKLLHNGRPLMIRGVCRHEWDPRTGKALSEESMLRDIKLLKQSNFNAVRCSHYPNHNRWYELCNIMGLHLVDEANMETHGFDAVFRDNHMHPANSSQWLPAMLDRCSRMYERDKNHPCVTLWSLGNECGYGPAHDAMAAMLRAKDPSRPVQYEGGGSRTSATDVVCPMYPRTKQIAALLTTGKDHRPIVLCEYAHSMGNSTGNFRDYWQQFESTPGCAGGFIWDWADQCLEAVWQEDLPGKEEKAEEAGGSARKRQRRGKGGVTKTEIKAGAIEPGRRTAVVVAAAEKQLAQQAAEKQAATPKGKAAAKPAAKGATPKKGRGKRSAAAAKAEEEEAAETQPQKPEADKGGKALRTFWAYGGDVVAPHPDPANNAPHDGQFCCNGVVAPDRTPHPALYEVKAVLAPMEASMPEGSAADGTLQIRLQNKYDMLDTKHLKLEWRAVAEGQPLDLGSPGEGWQALEGVPAIAPHTSLLVPLPCTMEKVQAAAGQATQAFIELRAMLKETPLWAEPGHVVASMQLPLQLPSGASQGSLAQRLLQRQGLAEAGFLAAAAGGAGGEGDRQAPKIEETPELLTLHCRGGEVAVRISRTSGCVAGITLKGRQLLEGELQPCLFRACTDNDRGGTKGSSYAARWLDAGLDRMERAGACTLETETKGGVTTVRSSWTMKPRQLSKEEAEARASKASGAGVGESGGSHWFAEVETLDEGGEQAPAAAEGDGRGAGAPSGTGPAQQGNGKEAGEGAEQAGSAEGEVKVEVAYTVHGASGLVESAWSVDAQRALPAPLPAGLTHSLPRVGITAPLSGALSDLTYYGRGPHENYMDRKYGAHMGLYTVSVPESRCPYVFPQEYGGREDVQWLLLRAPAHPSKPSAAKEAGGEGVAAAAAAAAEGGEAGPSAMEVDTEPKTAEPEPGKEEKDTEPKAAEPEPGKEKEGETAPTEGGSKTEAAGGEAGPGERKEGAEKGAAAKEEASKEVEAKTEERGAKEEAVPPAAAAAGAALAVFPTPVDSSAAFHMSASPFSLQALQEATHDCDLVPSGLTHLHLDHRHMGVGGDDSWSPSVREPYLISPGVYAFRVALLPCQCI